MYYFVKVNACGYEEVSADGIKFTLMQKNISHVINVSLKREKEGEEGERETSNLIKIEL